MSVRVVIPTRGRPLFLSAPHLSFVVIAVLACGDSPQTPFSAQPLQPGQQMLERDSKTDKWEVLRKGPGPSPKGDNSLRPDEIVAVARQHKPKIAACFDAQNEASGVVSVYWIVDLDGRVMTGNDQAGVPNLRIVETTLRAGPVHDCLLKEIATWTFPKPRNGVIATVTYPFPFSKAPN